MALPAILETGNSAAGKANVNTLYELLVALSANEDNAGFSLMAVKMGSASDPGGLYVERLRASDFGRLSVGSDTPAFNHLFPGSTLDSGIWTAPVTTMTATVVSGFCNLNAGASTTSSAVARVQSYQFIPAFKTFPTSVQMDVQFTQAPQANNVCEWGWFLASGTSAPTDGVFFRLTSTGELRCVLNNNGTETLSNAIDFATYVGTATTRQFYFTLGDAEVDFYIDDVHVAGINRPAAAGTITASMALPITFRNYNSGTPSLAQVMKVGFVNASYGDMDSTKAWGTALATMGRTGYQGQTGGTLGSTAIFGNSATPAAAVPTNTTAALTTGLGGIFVETDTLAVGTDGIVMSYQNPVGTAAVPGKVLYIGGFRIESHISTVIVGGGYVAMWGIAFGSSAVSLATTDSATSKAPRRIGPFGNHSVVAAAAALTQVTPTGAPIEIRLDTPIAVYPGEFIQLIRRKQSGTVSTSGALTHIITPINTFWE